MTIRIATPADLDAIMAIENASFPTDAWSSESMATELATEYSQYLVDEDAGDIIGYAGLRSIRGNADADIQTIALLEARRGEGRGRALLRTLLAEASARGAREVFLEVRADNPGAEALYLSEGFDEIARRPRYYQPENVDAIVMKLDLRAWADRAAAAAAAPHARAENAPMGGTSAEISPLNSANSAQQCDEEKTA
ncbi:ribosomal protein S18-alanine N-acetyltransferase [Microbacterium sp. A94]|uniref:ribosomal protein S18-alanine N-acetyltransferase n=1 Tax=Microbacterium sp. A94 TaxID=3450717 RepID=UPI003F421A12